MFILEDVCDLSEDEDQKISNEILGSWFPWFYNPITTSKKYFDIGHCLVKRPDVDDGREGDIVSPIFQIFHNIFNKFCKSHNIKFNKIHRAHINCSFYMPEEHGDIHIDHKFPHYNFLLYLNDFSKGSTYIFNEDNTVYKAVSASKYKAVVFDGQKHSQGFCSPGERRIVCVITFS
jgi:hypothetical protein